MENLLNGINSYYAQLVIGIILFFSLIEIISGQLKTSTKKFSDWIQEAGGFAVLTLLIKPFIILLAYAIGNTIFSEYNNYLLHSNFWILLSIYLLTDDFLQYWYHRSGHEYDFLWKLHRPHHQAEEMGFFISYRNAGMYYLLMPNIWWMGIFTFLGGGLAVAVGLVLKQLVIISSHSTVKWDEPLYKIKFLNPIMTVVERIIVTPAFHYAHHGKSKIDGISDPNGNYGNMFSLWDQIFKTATFTRKFPTRIGLENDPKEHWTATYFYPFIKSTDTNSELSKNHIKGFTKTNEPISVELVKGESYLWCKCGRSKNQPFCDGSHHGTKYKPVLFEARKDGAVKLCNCKITKSSPFCDNSHISLIKEK
jgi:sterol desaturase/sphingolipid hydroxylase (fatty acid hydroxylase superfamily)/CDGSH-type Zn-finger protein